jgi:hypothetical protein
LHQLPGSARRIELTLIAAHSHELTPARLAETTDCA